jgi:hypothetical protein
MPFRKVHCLGEVSGEADHRGLAGRVRGLRHEEAGEPQHTGDVDDGATRPHDASARLRHPVGAIEVDVDHVAKLVGGLAHSRDGIGDARVVDQYVHPTELLDRTGGDPGAGVGVGDVRCDRVGTTPFRADQPLGVRELVHAAGGQHDVGARLRQGLRETHAKTARSAGHHRDLSV